MIELNDEVRSWYEDLKDKGVPNEAFIVADIYSQGIRSGYNSAMGMVSTLDRLCKIYCIDSETVSMVLKPKSGFNTPNAILRVAENIVKEDINYEVGKPRKNKEPI